MIDVIVTTLTTVSEAISAMITTTPQTPVDYIEDPKTGLR
jgi:hypothetical protein